MPKIIYLNAWLIKNSIYILYLCSYNIFQNFHCLETVWATQLIRADIHPFFPAYLIQGLGEG